MDAAREVNAWGALLVGAVLNTTLLWFIKRNSSNSDSERLFYHTAINDFAVLAATFAYKPMAHGLSPLSSQRGGSPESSPWSNALMLVWLFTLFFAQFSTVVQFIHRYYVTIKGRVLSNAIYAAMLGVVGVGCWLLVVLIGVIKLTGNDGTAGTTTQTFPNNSSDPLVEGYVTVQGQTSTPYGAILASLYILFSIATYASATYCLMKLFRHSRQAFAMLPRSSKKRQLALQINTVLIALILITAFFITLPTGVILLGKLSLIGLPGFNSAMIALVQWSPSLSALAILLTMKSYRSALGRVLTYCGKGEPKNYHVENQAQVDAAAR